MLAVTRDKEIGKARAKAGSQWKRDNACQKAFDIWENITLYLYLLK